MDNVELVIKIVSVSLVPIVGYFGVQVINMMKITAIEESTRTIQLISLP